MSELIGEFICLRSSGFNGKSILELGCGLGLCGILAAKLGAINGNAEGGKVVFTDRDEEVLEFVDKNIILNGVQSYSYVERLEWDNTTESDYLRDHYTHNEGFDVIIASDCLYNQGNAAAKVLFNVVSRLLRIHDKSVGVSKDQAIIEENGKSVDINSEDNISENGIEIPPGDSGNWDKLDTENILGDVVSTRKPVFILGYTRRVDGSDMSIQSLLQIADAFGFQWHIAEDSVVDMFGNVTSERTMFWEHCVFLFTWK